jgi:branched-chain amino acid transport system substrate-binding protein
MLRRVGSAIGVVLGLTGLLSGCSGKPIVGVILPSTGAAASYGESIESGVRLAISDARERNELPVGFEVVWADTGSDPSRAVAEFKRMVEERGVKMVVGGVTSAEAVALIPEIEDAEVVCLSPSASAPGLARRSNHFFRIYPSDELEGHTAANFLHERLGKHEVLVFTGDTEYTRGIKPEFLKQYQEALNGTVVADIVLVEEDWRQRASQILDGDGVEAVYTIGYAEEILEVIRFLSERGYEGRIVTTSAFYSGQVIREAGEAAEGVMFPLPPFDRTSEKEPVLSFDHQGHERCQTTGRHGDTQGPQLWRCGVYGGHRSDPLRRLREREALSDDVPGQQWAGPQLPAIPRGGTPAHHQPGSRTPGGW